MAGLKHNNLLITGGAGLVGSHLIEALLAKYANLFVVVRSLDPNSYFASKKFHQKVSLISADLNNAQRIKEIVGQYEIDYIIHLGAQAIVHTAYLNPLQTLQTNIMGTVHVLEAARSFPKIKGVIVASSDKAYGKMKKNSYKETDPLQGDHPYEVSKSATDHITQMYFKTYGLPVVITRFGNIFGPGDLNLNRLIPEMCRCILTKQTLDLRSDGTFRRDYLYVKDVVNGYLKILKKFNQVKGEVFNFGSADNLSVLGVIKKSQKILGCKIPYKILNIQKNEIPIQSLQYVKAKRLLGWKPNYTFAKGLVPTFVWYQRYFVR